MSNISLIIAAAGSGTRMGGSIKKQYRQIENLPVLIRSVKAFCTFKEIKETIVVCPADDIDYVKDLLKSHNIVAKVVAGGEYRQASVINGLNATSSDCDYVLVHDAARPFVSADVIQGVITALNNREKAAIPCVSPKNTIRTIVNTLDRSVLFEVQTPQGFEIATLKKALAEAEAKGIKATDEASAVEQLGIKICLTKGDYKNIKITTEEDMPSELRVGHGYDVHRLVPDRPLMLGCVNVPYELGLLGHSDADVVAHAICDAILGAAALGDIGKHFPDNSSDTEGMSGAEILSKTAKVVRDAGFEIVNIDATLVAQQPKIAPFIIEMRENIAKALGIALGAVSVKATTEEGLGITGNNTAMAAHAVAMLKG